jgi:hypothetical protein
MVRSVSANAKQGSTTQAAAKNTLTMAEWLLGSL